MRFMFGRTRRECSLRERRNESSETGTMLLALCHRCWTWIEPKHDRCVECGNALDLHQPDPGQAELTSLFGLPLTVLGEVSLKRPRLPSFGVLAALENGLLFLPDLRQLPSGGYMSIEHGKTSLTGPARVGFWSLFARRTATISSSETVAAVRPPLTSDAAVERFLDSPGALFISRPSIVRVIQRGAMFRVERKPGKTVAFRIESSPLAVRDHLRKVLDHPAWKGVAAAVAG